MVSEDGTDLGKSNDGRGRIMAVTPFLGNGTQMMKLEQDAICLDSLKEFQVADQKTKMN